MTDLVEVAVVSPADMMTGQRFKGRNSEDGEFGAAVRDKPPELRKRCHE